MSVGLNFFGNGLSINAAPILAKMYTYVSAACNVHYERLSCQDVYT